MEERFITLRQAAAKKSLTPGRFRQLIGQKRIPGARKVETPAGSYWEVPEDFTVEEPNGTA
jgi:hypothetical protein